ncbi:DUF6446 family protein [Pseudaestuariivita atlantica]|uniref:Histidine kinase n=1 Tax=Pseudaestuariivita atlantica TaxID=1317121 RepID=A0A0L1JUZ3_9RHOB|nr:DUF6446 family protein [Pseudaestuariivita atlantica]KNG95502.1 histidine kinase [Pseudaestuariivita atlantica]
MAGRIVVGGILMIALVAGVVMYWLQVYGFYDEISDTGSDAVQLTSLVSGEAEPILYDAFRAIDSDSSPIRYRACFTTTMSLPMLTETYVGLDRAAPRVAPGWFDCFDAESIGEMLEDGRALAFLGEANIEFGIDRIVAITEDGRGYVWHDINECGDKSYDGSPLGDDCPEREAE